MNQHVRIKKNSTIGRANAPDSISMDPFPGQVQQATKAYIDALKHEASQNDDTPEHLAATKQSAVALEQMELLAEELFSRPIRSMSDCVAYATIIEALEDVPHEVDLSKEQDVGARAVGTFPVRLLQYAGASRLAEPRPQAERERLWQKRKSRANLEDDQFLSAPLSKEGEAIREFIEDLGGSKALADRCGFDREMIGLWVKKGLIPQGCRLRLWVESLRRGVTVDPSLVFEMSAEDATLLNGGVPVLKSTNIPATINTDIEEELLRMRGLLLSLGRHAIGDLHVDPTVNNNLLAIWSIGEALENCRKSIGQIHGLE